MRFWSNRFMVLGLSLLVGLAGANRISAFDLIEDGSGVYVIVWPEGAIPMKVMLPTSPTLIDGSTYSSSFGAAMEEWNAVLGTVQFTADVRTPGNYAIFNDTSEVVMDATIGGFTFGPNTLAVTISGRDGNLRTESDVVFNSAYNWNSYRGDLRSGVEDIRRVAVHELGHVLGLDHPDETTPPQSVTAIMNSTVSDIDGLQSDDIAGAQAMYGAPGGAPPNDDFADRLVLPFDAAGSQVDGTNVASGRETNEPGHGDEAGGRSVWWSWSPTEGGTAVLETSGSNFDTTMAVYTGDSLEDLVQIVSNDDVESGIVRTSVVYFEAEAGVTYHIAVDGWDGSTGQIVLSARELAPIGGPVILRQPRDRIQGVRGRAVFGIVAEGAEPLTVQWQFRPDADQDWVDLVDTEALPSISGSDTETLQLAELEESQSGSQYRARVTSGSLTIYSEVATLTVDSLIPVILSISPHQNLRQGEELLLEVEVWPAGVSYRWYGNGEQIASNRTSTYQVPIVRRSDAGVYYVELEFAGQSYYTTPIYVTVETGPGFVASSGGDLHAVYLRQNGQLVGSGDNNQYALGNDRRMRFPDPVATVTGVTQILAEEDATYVIKDDHSLWAFGVNRDLFDSPSEPIQLAENVALVSVLGNNALILRRDGNLHVRGRAFGDSEHFVAANVSTAVLSENSLFYVDAEGRLYEAPVEAADDLEAVLRLTQVDRVFASADAVMVILEDGTLLDADLGDDFSAPRVFADAGISDVASVSMGKDHNLILTNEGELWGEGRSRNGALGVLTTSVRPLTSLVTDVFAASAGDGFTHYIQNSGSIYGMGRNFAGMLGDGTQNDRTRAWVDYGDVSLPDPPTNLQATDGELEIAVRLSWDGQVSAGHYQIWRAASSDPADAVMLQDNWSGTIWHDDEAGIEVPHWYWVRSVNPAGVSPFGQPDQGTRPAAPPRFVIQPQALRVLADHDIYFEAEARGDPAPTLLWQRMPPGQSQWEDLVDGNGVAGATTARLSLDEVDEGWNGTRLRCLATNEAGSAPSSEVELLVDREVAVSRAMGGSGGLMFLQENGKLWSRGYNNSIEAGLAADDNRFGPTFVAEDVADAVMGYGYELVLKRDGSLWFRGENIHPTYVNGETSFVADFVQMASGIVEVDTGFDYVVYLDGAGRLWITGLSLVEAADGRMQLDTPRMVADEVVTVDASAQHLLYISADGALWGGGRQLDYVLGNNINAYTGAPIKIAENVVQIQAGTASSVFKRSDGSLWGMGNNGNGLLGLSDGYSTEPRQFLNDVSSFEHAGGHLLVVRNGTELWGSGYPGSGVLGRQSSSSVLPTVIANGARAVGSYGDGSLYIDESGTLRGIGQNQFGQLGAGEEDVVFDWFTISGGARGLTSIQVEPVASQEESPRYTRISWVPGPADFSYEVWRSLEDEFSTATRLVEDWPSPILYDANPVGGTDYHYWVVAEQMDRTEIASASVVGRRLPARELELSATGMEAGANGATFSLQVSSDTTWTTSSSEDWITSSISTGMGDGEFAVMVALNDTIQPRSGSLQIGGQSFSINQAGQTPVAPAINLAPRSGIARQGGALLLSVEVSGYPIPEVQWFFDGVAIAGANELNLEIPALTLADAGRYHVVATNSQGSVVSDFADVAVGAVSATFTAAHGLQSTETRAGSDLRFDVSLSGPGTINSLQWSVLLPEGWTFLRDSLATATSRPMAGEVDLLEWSWESVPALPFSFTFETQTLAGRAQQFEVVSLAEVSDAMGTVFVLATPDPLLVDLAAAFHSADTDGDFRLGLSELLRVIELYNTRFGTTRTGRYRPGDGVDGFAPDASSSGAHTPERFHSADTSRDGMLSLTELLRVIELYNTREGTTRTGGYRFADGTSDGFEPDRD